MEKKPIKEACKVEVAAANTIFHATGRRILYLHITPVSFM